MWYIYNHNIVAACIVEKQSLKSQVAYIVSTKATMTVVQLHPVKQVMHQYVLRFKYLYSLK